MRSENQLKFLDLVVSASLNRRSENIASNGDHFTLHAPVESTAPARNGGGLLFAEDGDILRENRRENTQ